MPTYPPAYGKMYDVDGFSRNRKVQLTEMNNQNKYRQSMGMPLSIDSDNISLYPAINGSVSNIAQIQLSKNDNKVPVYPTSAREANKGPYIRPMSLVRNTDMFDIREFNGERMKHNPNINNLAGTVYNNFLELSKYPILKHNPYEIHRLLMSPNLVMFTIYNDGKMIAYIIGEIIKLDDGRSVLYISYLYVSSKYRDMGLGGSLLNMAIQKAQSMNMNSIVLIVDTEDQYVLDFYMKRGFMYDTYLRRYDRYDVLSLPLK
jgi:ribosomal protein S18 acetylase RimI-like enzyme